VAVGRYDHEKGLCRGDDTADGVDRQLLNNFRSSEGKRTNGKRGRRAVRAFRVTVNTVFLLLSTHGKVLIDDFLGRNLAIICEILLQCVCEQPAEAMIK
jgi:hypothetical protein